MLYELLNFALRPFRRWWRRILVAAVISTLVVPVMRQALAPADDRDVVVIIPGR